MTVPMLDGSIATGRPAAAPSHAPPMSDSSHTAIQPQTTTDGDRDEDDHPHLGAIRRGGWCWRGKSEGMFTFVATQSRLNSLPSMSCITRHDSSSPSAG